MTGISLQLANTTAFNAETLRQGNHSSPSITPTTFTGIFPCTCNASGVGSEQQHRARETHVDIEGGLLCSNLS